MSKLRTGCTVVYRAMCTTVVVLGADSGAKPASECEKYLLQDQIVQQGRPALSTYSVLLLWSERANHRRGECRIMGYMAVNKIMFLPVFTVKTVKQ